MCYAFRMLQFLTAFGFYARGGIALGEMFVDTDRQLFVGKALVEAYEIEKSQDWVGCAVSENVETKFPNLFKEPPILDNVFPIYEVPMKYGPVKQMRTVNWRWNLVAQSGTRSMFQPTKNWPERRKVENTLTYAKFIRSSGKAYPRNTECPAELHAAFVAPGPPPPNALPTYPHGDDL